MTTMPDLTLSDIARLEAAADKATQGPWQYDVEEMLILPSPSKMRDPAGREGWCGEASGDDDGRHIANCDPATVKALCAAWRELESLRSVRLADSQEFNPQCGTEPPSLREETK